MQARDIALENSNGQIDVAHVLAALLEDQQGLLRSLISKAGGDAVACHRTVQKLLVRLPRQDPAPVSQAYWFIGIRLREPCFAFSPTQDDISASAPLLRVLKAAQALQKTTKESLLAVDHLLLALAEDKGMVCRHIACYECY